MDKFETVVCIFSFLIILMIEIYSNDIYAVESFQQIMLGLPKKFFNDYPLVTWHKEG